MSDFPANGSASQYQPRFASTVNCQRPTITRWCGPGVLSVLSGLDYDEIERRVNHMRGDPSHKRVTGMFLFEMKEMIEALGLVWIEMPKVIVDGYFTARYASGATQKCKVKCSPTFIRWLRDTREARGEDVYLVLTGDHVMLVKGEWIVDNCLRTPTPYELTKHRRRERVLGSFCILKDEEIAA